MPTAAEIDALNPWLVHVEFRRVQTYLFAVPRLRAMLGANSLVGVLLHGTLPTLLRSYETLDLSALAPAVMTPVVGDPLAANDQPRAQLANGILARDGGHFEAVFANEAAARGFATAARQKIGADLPGLLFDLHVQRLAAEPSRDRPAPVSATLVELPHFQTCDVSGNGIAVGEVVLGREDVPRVSEAAKRRFEQGERFARGDTLDWVGQLDCHLPCRHAEPPTELAKIGGHDYLAIVHADGLRIGQRAAGAGHAEGIQGRVDAMAFFARMRSAVRSALVAAMHATFGASTRDVRPFQLMMLGGDDLLLACRAPDALPFVRNYALALSDATRHLTDDQPLFVNAGVVISRPTVPFYRLHAIAETLASSAKRLARGLTADASTVDWTVFSGAWSDDPIAQRQQHAIRKVEGTTLVLSGRPLPTLGVGLDTLSGLIDKATHLNASRPARSQLRGLVDALARGEHEARLVFAGLPSETHKALASIGVTAPWEPIPPAADWRLSRLADLIEVYEIERLGRARPDDAATTPPPAQPAEAQ